MRFPLTGIGRYTYELAKHLPNAVPGIDLQFMAGGRFVRQLPTEQTASNPNQSVSAAGRLRRWAQNNSTVAVSAYRAWISQREARALQGYEDAIYHGPTFHLPPFSGRSVVTIHDLSVYSWAHCHPPGRVRNMQRAIANAVRQADIILTDSEYTRHEVASFFSLRPERIMAVPLASADSFRLRTHAELSTVLPRFGLQADGYCLYSGTIEPRKNLEALLDAYGMLPSSTRDAWPLVLCGYQGWRSDELHKRIIEAQSEGWVRYLGYVSGDDLPYIFAGARLFTFPSLYEGFGLPVLEAMASGVPVVCSNSSSLPEVAGDAALMCQPEDVYTLAELIKKGLEDNEWRTQSSNLGRQRAGRFSWALCAAQTAEAYRAAVLQ